MDYAKIKDAINEQLALECKSAYSRGYQKGAKEAAQYNETSIEAIRHERYVEGWKDGRASIREGTDITKQQINDAYDFLEGVVGEYHYKKITELAYQISKGKLA